MPWYETGESLARKNHGVPVRCTCCDRDLSGHAVRMLELDQRTGAYHDCGGVPAEWSQGAFPFGLKCARKALARRLQRSDHD